MNETAGDRERPHRDTARGTERRGLHEVETKGLGLDTLTVAPVPTSALLIGGARVRTAPIWWPMG